MRPRYLAQPIRIVGSLASLALTDDGDRHLRDKLLAVLFTSPGERVNRPDFGVGLRRSTFEGVDELMLAALRFRILQGLRRDVGTDIAVDDLRIAMEPDQGLVSIVIDYRRVDDNLPRGLEVQL